MKHYDNLGVFNGHIIDGFFYINMSCGHGCMLIVRELSKSSELYLIALSRDISERHATYYLNELAVSLKMMLMSPRCVVSLNSYGILSTPYHYLFSCYI